tara:strand:- start:229 stop:402 length:174 start_codon:yes stop_codon:yes gene_type:complete
MKSKSDYSEAYKKYLEYSRQPMTLEQFEKEIHRLVYDTDANYFKPSFISKEYKHLIK